MSDERHRIVVGSINVQGQAFDVWVDPRGGLTWRTTIGETEVSADSADHLARKVSVEVSRQRIEHKIAVVLDLGTSVPRYRRAVLRGRNARTHAFLMTWPDGTKFTADHPRVVALGEDLTDTDLDELNRLAVASAAAEAASAALLKAKAGEHRYVSAGTLLTEAERALARTAQ